MEYKTKDGKIITDEMIEEWAKGYESGNWPGDYTGEIIVGRPKVFTEELVTVTFKIPKSRLEALDCVASKHGETRSELIRAAVDGVLEFA